MRQLLQDVGYMIMEDDIELAKGVDLRPLLERLIDLEQTISLRVLAKHMFSGQKTSYNQSLMMRYFERLTKLKKMRHVPEFISDNSNEEAISR